MNSAPIGIFDSGLGGLTAYEEVRRLLLHEDIVYFGDSARIPYGTKSKAVIKKYAEGDCRFLLSLGVKAILVACGTVSSNALDYLRESFDLPIVGVIDGAAKKAVEIAKKKNKRIAVLGTSATVNSGAYEKEILRLMPDCKVTQKACPLFVPLVENGHTAKDGVAELAIAHEYLDEIACFKPDAVILGCTHYPLLSSLISSVLGDCALVSSGVESAREFAKMLEEKELLNNNGGKTLFYTSDDIVAFSREASIFIGGYNTAEIKKTDIENY